MGQIDRNLKNTMLKRNKETQNLSVAPIYDYSLSYGLREFRYYKNPYLFMEVNRKNLIKFIKKSPEIMNYVEILKNIPMEKILSDIEKEKEVLFTEDEKKDYVKKDEEYTKILKNI